MNATLDGKKIVEARDLPLDAWLRLILTPEDSREVCLCPDFCFPSSEHRDAYLADIATRDRREVKALIRAFLMSTGCLGNDFDLINDWISTNPDAALESERVRRAVRGEPVWEGITWVLDLLHRPRMAIQVIHAYLAAHFWSLPDWRMNGLFDAMKIIRAAYLEPIHPRDELLSIAPRDFEFVVALLFQRMGFEVIITQQTSDGGFDVRLRRNIAGSTESSVVECKRYSRNVPVREMRALLGVVERDGLTRGLLVTTGGFTRTTRSEASRTNRIELIEFQKLCSLLNEYFSSDWPADIDRIISDARRQFETKNTDDTGIAQQDKSSVRGKPRC